MNQEPGKHIGERRLSESELMRLKLRGVLYCLLSISLGTLFPFALLGCLIGLGAISKPGPLVLLMATLTFLIPAAIAIGSSVSWARSRDFYNACKFGIVQQFCLNSVIIERLSISSRLWKIEGDLVCLQPNQWNPTPSLYVWPDMLPGTTRKMTIAEKREIRRIWFQDVPVLAVLLGVGYTCVELIRFLAPYSKWGLFWQIGTLIIATLVIAFAVQLLLFGIVKLVEICLNISLIRDLIRGQVNQYYNMVSGKTVELLPISRRPWTVGGEPFYWRRKGPWK